MQFILCTATMCMELVTFSTFIMTKGRRKKRKKGNVVCVEEINGEMDKETISPRPKEWHDSIDKDIHRQMGLCLYELVCFGSDQ